MEAQDELTYKLSDAEISDALLDFARLSQQVAAPDMFKAIPDKLLERLLRLCLAQCGAILLTISHPVRQSLPAAPPLHSTRVFRPFALSGMSEEEALALLPTDAGAGAKMQVLASNAGWLLYRYPLPTFLIAEGELEVIEYTAEHPEPIVSARLILGWRNDHTSALQRARAALPRVATGVGATIQSVLLAEHMHELETASTRKELREMELLKAELLATVSHELRSPLASIKGYATTLLRHERRISRAERHDFLLAINAASDRLTVIVDRLLQMSQLETGAITLERAPVNIAHLVREAIIAQEESLKVRGITRVTFRVLPEGCYDQPTQEIPVVQADRLRLREVLDNILENAVKYSPDGGTISITLRPMWLSEQPEAAYDGQRKQRLADRPGLEISIQDQGIGIPREHLQEIFQRFHRVDSSLTREYNGLGLGLAICKFIVELHQGRIWAESEPDKGSTFHIWLPLDDTDALIDKQHSST